MARTSLSGERFARSLFYAWNIKLSALDTPKSGVSFGTRNIAPAYNFLEYNTNRENPLLPALLVADSRYAGLNGPQKRPNTVDYSLKAATLEMITI